MFLKLVSIYKKNTEKALIMWNIISIQNDCVLVLLYIKMQLFLWIPVFLFLKEPQKDVLDKCIAWILKRILLKNWCKCFNNNTSLHVHFKKAPKATTNIFIILL